MKACLLLFFYFSFICQLHGADVKIKQNESMMGSTAMTYDLSEKKLMKLKYKSQHGDSEASFRLYQYYCFTKEGANKQVISSQADSLIKISRIWADFFPANTSNQPI